MVVEIVFKDGTKKEMKVKYDMSFDDLCEKLFDEDAIHMCSQSAFRGSFVEAIFLTNDKDTTEEKE